ncbi:MAG: recombination mediator RecR [Candidatus Brocadiia bacterium]
MAKGHTESFERLMEQLGRMPGVGERTAERLAYHVLRLSREEALALAEAIREVKERVKQCSRCFHFSETDPCAICSDPERDQASVCVVEQAKDVVAMEQSGYRGVYHVLCGRLAPLDGMEPEDLTVDRLVERVSAGGVEEVILACNADMEGEATAMYVREALAGLPVRVTRLARGIPSGSQLEYANAAVLADALEGRREMGSETTRQQESGEA